MRVADGDGWGMAGTGGEKVETIVPEQQLKKKKKLKHPVSHWNPAGKPQHGPVERTGLQGKALTTGPVPQNLKVQIAELLVH